MFPTSYLIVYADAYYSAEILGYATTPEEVEHELDRLYRLYRDRKQPLDDDECIVVYAMSTVKWNNLDKLRQPVVGYTPFVDDTDSRYTHQNRSKEWSDETDYDYFGTVGTVTALWQPSPELKAAYDNHLRECKCGSAYCWSEKPDKQSKYAGTQEAASDRQEARQ